jgi:hypothetical protein
MLLAKVGSLLIGMHVLNSLKLTYSRVISHFSRTVPFGQSSTI